MLSDLEKNECRKILSMLSSTEVFAIKDTITNNSIATENTEEAINVIVTYSTTSEEFLNRKKVKKELLFQYIHNRKIPIANPHCCKAEMVAVITNWWRSQKNTKNSNASGTSVPSLDSNPIKVQYETDTGQQIAREFIHWFYPMLNKLIVPTAVDKWGPDHFWPDVNLTFVIVNERNLEQREVYDGALAVQERLASMVKQDGVVFNVNTLPNGYKGSISAHGIAKVGACGSMHKVQHRGTPGSAAGGEPGPGELIGIFEQYFGLVRDPADDNRWKIKISQLKIKIIIGQHQDQQTSLSEDILKSIAYD